MNGRTLRVVIFGLSVTSSWGNGHATVYRGLMRELAALGHNVLFLERDVPWYAAYRDLPRPPYGRTRLYTSLREVTDRYHRDVRQADLVIVGSYVPEAVALGVWVTSAARGVTAFYDIDTPVTLAKLQRSDEEYLSPGLIPRYDLYLSFTGGPILDTIERDYKARRALPLYCAVDPRLYYPEDVPAQWDLGYMGTYSADRQASLESLLLEPARRWPESRLIVAGPLYPPEVPWPANVERVEHLPPGRHRRFYNAQRYSLNVTRSDMIRAGYAPSVRLFEAAACGTPIISDYWRGLNTFFRFDSEILIARTPADTLRCLRDLPDQERRAIGQRARARVLAQHTAAHRAAELVAYTLEALGHVEPAAAMLPRPPVPAPTPVLAEAPRRPPPPVGSP